MSRRFGRNQRRRMREQVASLQGAMEMDRGLLRHQSWQLDALRNEISRAKRMVGHHSALFEPESMRLSGPKRGAIESYVSPPMDFAAVSDLRADSLTTTRIPLDVMLTRVDEGELDMCQHVRVQFGDGIWGYAISRAAMLRMPRRDLVEIVSKELAALIARDLKP